MAVLHQESVLAMIKEFRRNWHTLCASERTTLCGADAMLLVLQLSMAENNKQSQLRDFLSGRQSAVDDETDLCVPPSPVSEHWSQDNEKVKFLAKKIIYSYLNLLVNSKDDLALAHILNVPDRGLGREAFTDLKHAAQEKQMSIFLVATSFVRTIQLGGKGYAPSPSDPLRTHIKGLSNFINFIDKLDEILGEISNPRSPIQVNNSLVKPLRERLHRSMEEKKIKMKQTLIRSQFSCTYKDDCLISRNTWNNVNSASKPSCVLHMENDLSEGVNSSVGRPTIGTSSGNVHLDRSKNEKVERKSSSQTGNKSSKRKQVDLDDENILCDNGNEPPQHKNVKIPKTSNDLQNKLHGKPARVAKSNKCTAKDKLITGQTKLTQFFRL
ncbi:PCNA-interacting partner isoform X16 [Pteronotus mesoamericanus]|uniref:PCNA-interacting partner isoform X16 n=1 Tax=Pteronotus mesoamericanus TaxID=1884717 RepID=UPI0023EC0649|nr:PCNA-interacting partner isoform X16 [Pteronotus parnellii mesoamericanus]